MATSDRVRVNARALASLVAALLVAIVLAGCSGTTDEAPAAGSSAAPAVADGGFLGANGFATDPPADWLGDTVPLDALPAEAIDTLELVAADGPFPYDQDGSTFFNREGLLPTHPTGHYEEFTVETPGLSHRGARRLVVGDAVEVYYTDDHYDSFRFVVP
jgi:ribonuclease T1